MKNQGENILMACIYLINSKLLVTMFGNAGYQPKVLLDALVKLEYGIKVPRWISREI